MSYQARVSAMQNEAFRIRVGTLLTRAAMAALDRDDIPNDAMPMVLKVCHAVFFDYARMEEIATRVFVSLPGTDVALAQDMSNLGSAITDETILAALTAQFTMFARVWEV